MVSLPANCLRTDDYICSTLFRRTCLSWHFKETLFKRTRFWLPFILSSLIFASQHGISNWVAILMYTMMGMIFYLAYHRRRNVRDSMMVHMIHNGVSGIMVLVSYFMVFLVKH